MIIFGVAIGGALGYRLGKSIFSDPEVEETLRLLHNYVKELKKSTKERGNTAGDAEK